MKYVVYAGLVALMVLICLPAAVSAATEDTVVVSGSIGGSLSVDVTPNDPGVSWGEMSVGTKTDLTSADLSVVTTFPAWHVDAADAKGTNKGFMVDSTVGKLDNAFEISKDGGTGWTAMTGTFTNFQQKISNGAGTWPFDIGLKQVITADDEAATNYQITITFTGAAS